MFISLNYPRNKKFIMFFILYYYYSKILSEKIKNNSYLEFEDNSNKNYKINYI